MDRSALNKATSADDTPTPGYLYTEIAQSTFADLNACQQLADYLIKKLEKDNPHVKLKCLKIIKHVCEQGKPEFKRAIQRKAEVVKACLQYRGTPDPLKGDAPNKAVREEADLAVKAVFSSNASLNAYGFSTGQGKKMQGFGSEPSKDISSRIGNLSSNSFSGGGGSFEGGGRSFGSGGMVGFGNPNFDNAPPRKDDDSVFNKAMSSTMSAVSYLQSKVTGAPPLPMPSSGGGSDGTYRPPAVGGGFGGDRGGGDHCGFGGGFNSSYSGGSGYSAPSHSYSSAAGGQQNYGIHGPGGAHRRWGHRTAGDGSDARGGDGGRSEAHEATPEAKPAPPPAMVDLLDMEEPSPQQNAPGGNSASLLDEGPSAAAASEDLLGGGESLMETLNSQTPSFSIPPGEVPGNNLMGGIDMTTAAPANVANVANAAAAQGAGGCGCGGCGGCGGGMPGMGMAGSVGGSMGSQAPMMGQPPMPQAGGSMGSSMGNPMGQPPMGGGPMGGAMGMGGGMGMGMGAMGMGGMGPMGMGAMGCGGCGGCNCGGCGMGGPQMGCGCGMGAMGCGPPMGGPMGMCGGCNMQGSMGGCAPNMGMGMMPQQPMNSMNQAAYSPPAAAPPPYQNGSMPMQAMGSMSTPSGGGSAFSFIGGSSASPQISPQVAPKPPDMAFGFVAEEMKGAVG